MPPRRDTGACATRDDGGGSGTAAIVITITITATTTLHLEPTSPLDVVAGNIDDAGAQDSVAAQASSCRRAFRRTAGRFRCRVVITFVVCPSRLERWAWTRNVVLRTSSGKRVEVGGHGVMRDFVVALKVFKAKIS